MSSYRFEIPGCPVPKQRARKGKGGHWYTPDETFAYERKVKMCALAAGVRKLEGDVAFRVSLFVPDNRRRDRDNMEKAIQDALNGTAWRDDSSVKVWGGRLELDPKRPRAVVTIRALRRAG